MEFFVRNLIVAGLSDWGCVLIPTGLPAELIPHDFPEAVASGKRMLKQEIFYLVASWGCVTEYLGLPAELIPQSWCVIPDDMVYYTSQKSSCQHLFSKSCKKIPPELFRLRRDSYSGIIQALAYWRSKIWGAALMSSTAPTTVRRVSGSI